MFNCKKVLKALSLPTVRLMSTGTSSWTWSWILPASTSTSSTILLEAGRVAISVSARATATYKFHEKSKFMQKLVNKKGAKTKKQWYKPHLGEPLEVESKKTKRGISHSHSVRLRQLSHVLYDKIIEIINTGELSQEILEKHVSITAESPGCPHCGAAIQDAEHLVVHCPITRIRGEGRAFVASMSAEKVLPNGCKDMTKGFEP